MSTPELNNTHYKDFTIKARIENLEEMHGRLMALAEFIGQDHQRDTYFKTDRGKLKWRQGTIENLITHYERVQHGDAERTQVYRYELNPTDADIAALHQESEVIGVVEKERAIYKKEHIKIHLDQLPSGDCFLEIEAIDRTDKFSIGELREQTLHLLSKLEITPDQWVPTGYLRNK